MRGRNSVNLAQAQFVKINQLLAAGVHAFGLVSHKNARLAQAAQVVGNVVVLGRQALARINDKKHDIGLGYGLARLVRHFAVNAAFACIWLKAACVDNDKFAPPVFAVAIVAVAGKACKIGHDSVARFGQAVKQGGFAHIGAPDQGNNRFHLFFSVYWTCRPATTPLLLTTTTVLPTSTGAM